MSEDARYAPSSRDPTLIEIFSKCNPRCNWPSGDCTECQRRSGNTSFFIDISQPKMEWVVDINERYRICIGERTTPLSESDSVELLKKVYDKAREVADSIVLIDSSVVPEFRGMNLRIIYCCLYCLSFTDITQINCHITIYTMDRSQLPPDTTSIRVCSRDVIEFNTPNIISMDMSE